MADVFISYKTERRNAAQHLSRILELNGFSVWFDYGLLSGADFGPQIERELRAAKAVVVLWCRLSHDSHWVLEEAHLAERLGTLTPVWLEPVELPLGFGRADTIDLSSWDGSPRSPSLDRLLNEVGRRVGRDPAPSYRGLQNYEETWRSFGAPPLTRFALLDAQAEEARAFSVQARLDPPPLERAAAPKAASRGSAATATRTRSSWRPAAFAGIAALAVIGGAGAWYWAGQTPRNTPAPPAQTSEAAQPPAAPAPGSQGNPPGQADKSASATAAPAPTAPAPMMAAPVASPPPVSAPSAPSPAAAPISAALTSPAPVTPTPPPSPTPAAFAPPEQASPPPAPIAPAPPGPSSAAPPTQLAFTPVSPSTPIPPAPLVPPPGPMPINAPLASFQRSNTGWSVALSFVEPVAAISWRLGDTGKFKETGFLDILDARTRRRLARPAFELDADQTAATIEIRAVDPDGREAGPFPITFDPDAELERGDRRILEMTAGAWLAFGQANGPLLYYTHLVSYRCGIREVRIGIDSTVPNKVVPLADCDPKHPFEIPASAQPYLRLPPKTQMVSVELTYRDGTVSETKTFRR